MKYRILCLAAVAALVLLSGCSGGTKQEITYENLNSSDITLSVTQGTAADFAVSEKFPDTKIDKSFVDESENELPMKLICGYAKSIWCEDSTLHVTV